METSPSLGKNSSLLDELLKEFQPVIDAKVRTEYAQYDREHGKNSLDHCIRRFP